MKFKDKLKQTRIEHGMTRKELAEKAGMSFKTIDKYEQGTRFPTIDSLLKLTNALDANISEFIECIPDFNRIVEIYKNGIQK